MPPSKRAISGKFLPEPDKERQLPAARNTVLRDIFPEWAQQPGADTNIRLIPHLRETFPALYAKILMACEKKQVRLLKHLWGEPMGRSPYLEPAVRFIVHQGQVPDFLDLSSEKAARELVAMIRNLREENPPPLRARRHSPSPSHEGDDA
jgi:hypothetical protein